MAENQIGPINTAFVDKRAGHTSDERPTAGDYSSIKVMRTTLSANGYTKQQLDSMTVNDMVYAVRLISDKAGIN